MLRRVRSSKYLSLKPVGFVRSPLKSRVKAPKQGSEGAPEAWIELSPGFVRALAGVTVGDQLILLTWLHKSDRTILKVHPRGDKKNPLTGVFATRSPDRPNPIGLHRVTVHEIVGNRIKVGPLEAIDGTPVIDVKPVLSGMADF